MRHQGSVSNVEMVPSIALIYKVRFPSISTFETPPESPTGMSTSPPQNDRTWICYASFCGA